MIGRETLEREKKKGELYAYIQGNANLRRGRYGDREREKKKREREKEREREKKREKNT